MYCIYDLDTEIEVWYGEEVPRKQALKTTYAINNNLGTQLAINFGQLMNDLEEKIVDANHFWSIDNLTVKKEIYAD